MQWLGRRTRDQQVVRSLLASVIYIDYNYNEIIANNYNYNYN